MKAFVAALSVALLLLAGCSSTSNDSTSTTPTSSSTTSKSTTTTKTTSSTTGTTSTTPPGGDPAPVITTFTASVAAGAAPLVVNFTLDATDPQGEKVTWTVDLADGSPAQSGTTLPATFSHNFTAAGNYTVKATVTDGNNNVNKTVTVRVTADPGAGVSVSAAGSVTAVCTACLGTIAGTPVACAGLQAETNELDCWWVELPAEAAGLGLTATSSNGIVNFLFLASCAYDADILETNGDQDSPYATTVPEGAGCWVQYEYLDAVPIDYTLEVA